MSLPTTGQHFAPVDVDAAEISGMSATSADKRPAEDPPADASPAKKPMRINRSCDQCRNTRFRCSGFLPCQICTSKGKECSYVAPFYRGRMKTPPPPPDDLEAENARHRAKGRVVRGKVKRFRSWESIACDRCRVMKIEKCSGKQPCEVCFGARVECSYKYVPDIFDVGAPRDENEPLPDPSTFLEAKPGPLDPELEKLQPARRYAAGQTPPLVFLHRAWRKIAHPSSPASMRSSDQPFDRSAPFRLPPQYRWPELMDQFWSGFSGTFHVLHRPSVQQWADVVEQNGSSGAELWEGISRAKAAIVLMALALGSFYRDRAHRDKKANKPDEWIWSLNFGDNLFSTSIAFTDAEDGYPTLESAQVRLLQDIYLICTSRFLQAWNTFGNTLQTITALGYHRRIGRNRGLGLNVTIRPNYAKLQCERRLFWSVYILDKQLSIMLGKPSNLNDDTIDQELPDAVNDEDCDENGPIRAHPSDCYMEALVSHAKLNKILERIFSEVYTLRDVPEDERLACAYRRGADVEDWHTNLPPLISKQRETTLLPIFRRQATLLRLAYYHAQMLVYRPFLMAPYPHWGERKRAADSAVRDCLEACRLTTTVFFDLARNMQPRMFGTIWYAHQVGYCAASIMYMIPHFRERQRLFGGPHYRGYESTDKQKMELADRVADTLADGTNPYSPGPRCAVILRELKAEAERQMNPNNPPEPIQTDSEITSPSEQLLADALRADWEADLSGHVTWNPQNPTEGAAPGGPKRLWDTFKITDWVDLDSAAFGPISDFASVEDHT